MTVAWYIAPYRTRASTRGGAPLVRYCSVNDAGLGDVYVEGEVLGGYAVVRADATPSELDAIDAVPGVESLRGNTLITRLASLTTAQRNRLFALAEALGYSAGEVTAWLTTPDPTLFDFFEFVGQRRLKPRYDVQGNTIVLDGAVQKVHKPWRMAGGAGGEFPTTSLLDAFTGADETPIATNWSGPIFSTDGQMRRISNALTGATGASQWSSGYYDLASYTNAEVWFTVTTFQSNYEFSIACKVMNPGSVGATDTYEVFHFTGTPPTIAQIFRTDNDVGTQLGANVPVSLADGVRVGMSCIGTTLTYYVGSATVWNAIARRFDTTYAGIAGRIGVYINSGGTPSGNIIDDFGGGEYTYTAPARAFPAFSDYPKEVLRV